jgi:hypothetical protein
VITRIGPHREEIPVVITAASGHQIDVIRVRYVIGVETYCVDQTTHSCFAEISEIAAGFPAMVAEAFQRLETRLRDGIRQLNTHIVGEEPSDETKDS